ncbi:MAG: sugar phosphate isomerase/epimerase [Lachnospiraceae bacterium]|nr:sugar phosphate isomerase/epimerase [Lachnospiraceae bacterium]
MKLGVLTVPLSEMPVGQALSYLKGLGAQAVEIGCGGFPGNAHCDPEVLLKDRAKLKEFKETIKASGLEISAFSAHGNAVHPDEETAKKAVRDFENAVYMAEEMEVGVVNTFSGCPGDSEGSRYPNWVTCPWPDDFTKILDYQWNDKLLPYWRKAAEFAGSHGVKVAFEMHPGFCVYNTETMLRIHREIGPALGANYDPSHLFWQGMDGISSIRELAGIIYHVHAKDCKIDAMNTARTGVLDTKPYGDELHRSWIFRTVGYGHDLETWKDIISALRMAGYDGAVSIEHEDSLMSVKEGLEKAVSFLKEVLIEEKPAEMWWA